MRLSAKGTVGSFGGHMVKESQIAREETRCRHMGYSLWLTARVILYASSHRHQSWSAGWNEK